MKLPPHRTTFILEGLRPSLSDTDSHPPHSLFCQTSEQVNSSMKALQAEKERLMRSVSEREAELSSLRQAAQAQQSSLQQEQERNSRELGELQGKLQEKVSSREARARSRRRSNPLCRTPFSSIMVADIQFTSTVKTKNTDDSRDLFLRCFVKQAVGSNTCPDMLL